MPPRWDLPPTLTARHRAVLHAACSEAGIGHASSGDGDARALSIGDLTPAATPVSLAQLGHTFSETLSMKGEEVQELFNLTIRRGDFAIGEGPWAKFDIVANDVIVKFHITANAK